MQRRRNHVLAGCPISKIDEPAALATKREFSVLARDLRLADRAVHNTGVGNWDFGFGWICKSGNGGRVWADSGWASSKVPIKS